MQRRFAASILFGTTIAACTSLDAAPDRAEVHADLEQRTGTELPGPEARDDAEIAAEVERLLASPLDETACVRTALLNNHAVRAVHARLGVARADLVQAGLLRNPTFDLDVRFLEGGGTDAEFGLSQSVLELFFLPLRKRLAEHEFQRAKLLLTDELLRLVFDVRRAFVAAWAAERTLELHRETLAMAEEGLAATERLHAAGTADGQALALQRALTSRARLDVSVAEQALNERRELLQQLLGLWGGESLTLVDELADAVLAKPLGDELEQRAVASSLDLAARNQRLDGLAAQAGLDEWRGWFPGLVLGPNGIRLPGGTFGFGPRIEGELPLFDSGAARRAATDATLQATVHDQVQAAVLVRSTARLLGERAATLAERVRVLRDEHLPLREAALERTETLYRAGRADLLAVLAQRQQLLDDRRDLLDARGSAHTARRDLAQLLTGSLPN